MHIGQSKHIIEGREEEEEEESTEEHRRAQKSTEEHRNGRFAPGTEIDEKIIQKYLVYKIIVVYLRYETKNRKRYEESRKE